jgi:indole-3-glycerol phosphate synthase
MNGILGEILEYKKKFIKESKQKMPFHEIEQLVSESGPTRDFAGALKKFKCSLIAEIKTASPSKGIIRDDVNIEDVARIYSENGASCISVLTDERFFKGNLERLSVVKKNSKIPLLRKDFIIDIYQIFEARYAGADAVLLIAACLSDDQYKELKKTASMLKMDCLSEVHDLNEMERIGKLGVDIVGINNRDLKTFKTDISTTAKLAPFAPENALVVSESGINSAEDVRIIYNMGADAVLIGETLMKEKNMAKKVEEFAYAIV